MSKLRILSLALGLLVTVQAAAEQRLVSTRVAGIPFIDGRGDDAVWSRATAITTRDAVAGIDVTLKSVYTDEEVFFLVQFPDDDEDRDHKKMLWDGAQERYRTGPVREDTFVLKWSMEPRPVDLTLTADTPYKADVWYWKSHRTDHAGHADDKFQVYSPVASQRAKKMRSKSGARFYLSRRGDDGDAAYHGALQDSFVADELQKYDLRSPTGSRADIRAKGAWKNGMWTVEFRRRLDTGYGDDVQFAPSRSYHFGVSRFEIAGRKPDPKVSEPNFGSGDVGERLILTFG